MSVPSPSKAFEAAASSELAYIKVNTVYDEQFRAEPHFQALMKKVGL